jgi:predicted TPR repeat methyltransferase
MDSTGTLLAASDIPQAIAAGIAHHRAGRLPEAETIYRKVLSVDSNNPDALNLLGAIAHQAGRYRDAIDYIGRAIASYEQAIPAKPLNPYAYSNLGEAYRAAGDSVNARTCYEKALAINPEYAEAHYHLGLVLAAQGDDDEAIACYRKALSLKPELLLARYNLGLALKGRGRLDEATSCFREILSVDPDNELAQFSLSALTAQNPERPPERHVANLFDNHAPRFDAHLVEKLRYRVPDDLIALARRHAKHPEERWDVLDLGCGTGLAGVAVAPYARQLVGVDLSTGMLEKARARNLYQRLEQRDLLAMMSQEQASSYDVILAADVLVYLGNLADVVREAARLLREDGLLAVSVEALDASGGEGSIDEARNDYRLQVSGRYSHSTGYLRRLAHEVGFRNVEISPTELRLERGIPVRGWLAVLAM